MGVLQEKLPAAKDHIVEIQLPSFLRFPAVGAVDRRECLRPQGAGISQAFGNVLRAAVVFIAADLIQKHLRLVVLHGGKPFCLKDDSLQQFSFFLFG